jgi:hypothetical protein
MRYIFGMITEMTHSRSMVAMWKWLFRRPLRARNAVLWFSLPLLLVGCNLNQSPTGETQAITGAPSVQIVAPQPNAIYREGVSVPVQAQIGNAGSDIARVEVLVDGSIVETFAAPNSSGALVFPITYTWTAAGAGPHTIDVTAFRADETSGSATVGVTVVAQAAIETQSARPTTAGGSGAQASPTAGSGARPTTAPAQASNTPAPTNVPPTATSSRPQVTTLQGVNVRSGPGTIFAPAIGSLAANQTVDLLARNPGGDWYKIRYYNGEGWVFANLVQVSGDITNLAIDPGPPPPPPTQPPLPTLPPATPVPATNVNLVAGNWRFDPAGDPTCNQTFNIFFDVANLGSGPTTTSGSISVRDVRQSDGSQQGATTGAFPIIQAGQTFNAGPIPITISTFWGEQHRIILTINPDSSIPETSRDDNVREILYTLQRGSCP